MQNTDHKTEPQLPLIKRLGWFVGIWAASALGLALVSYGLKAIIPL